MIFGRINIREWQSHMYLSKYSHHKSRGYTVDHDQECIYYKNLIVSSNRQTGIFSIAVDEKVIVSRHMWNGDLLAVPKGPWRKDLKKLYRKLKKDNKKVAS